MDAVIEKLPILKLVLMFVFYIISHIGIGMYISYLEKKKSIEFEKDIKVWKNVFKWYPAIIIIIYILMLIL